MIAYTCGDGNRAGPVAQKRLQTQERRDVATAAPQTSCFDAIHLSHDLLTILLAVYIAIGH